MRRNGPLILLALVAVLTVGALIRLFELRWAIGDVYPPYSSLRSDPLGTKALFLAVEEMRALGEGAAPAVVRSTEPLASLEAGGGTTVLLAGLAAFERLPEEPWLEEELNRILTRSARVVVTLAPVVREPLHLRLDLDGGREDDAASEGEDAEPEAGGAEGSEGAGEDGEGASEPGEVEGAESPAASSGVEEADPPSSWGIGLELRELPKDEDGSYRSVSAVAWGEGNLPESLEWRSALVFAEVGPAWEVHYVRDEAPVVVSRRVGSGTLVLASDSFFLSNEGLHREPAAPLLAWLLGDCERLVVDEAHLGVRDPGGVVVLARRYGLGGFALGLLLVAGLVIWQTATPFLPPLPAAGLPTASTAVSGRGSAEGLVTLLERGVPRSRLLAVCIDEWARHSASRRDLVATLIDIAAGAPSPVVGYRRLASHLAAFRPGRSGSSSERGEPAGARSGAEREGEGPAQASLEDARSPRGVAGDDAGDSRADG